MAADLYLYAVNVGPVEWAEFQAHRHGEDDDYGFSCDSCPSWDDPLLERIYGGDRVWVTSVSWLKAELTDDLDRYVPRAALRLARLYDPEPVRVTRPLIAETMVALSYPNHSIYGRTEHYTDPDTVEVNWSDSGGWGRRPRWRWPDDEYRSRRTRIRLGGYRLLRVRKRGVSRHRPVRAFLEANLGCDVWLDTQ